jgi:hypothetical protein
LEDQPTELYRYTRLVSRWVYILVYVLGIVRVSLYLFDVNHAQPGHSSHLPAVRSLADFQFYVFCSIIPLWAIRALVLTMPATELTLVARRCVTQIVGLQRTPRFPPRSKATHLAYRDCHVGRSSHPVSFVVTENSHHRQGVLYTTKCPLVEDPPAETDCGFRRSFRPS